MRATATMGGSMPPKSNIDTSTYSGRIAARMRELREQRGWTVAELCERLNRELRGDMKIAVQTLHSWDSRKRRIDSDYLPAIAGAFGLSVRAFIPKD